MKASAWKWIAIAFIVLFVIATLSALGSNYNYNAAMSSLQSCNSSLQSCNAQLSEAWSLLYLKNKTILVKDQTITEAAGSAYYFYFDIPYAGYIEVVVSFSTSPNTYVEISGTYDLLWDPNNGWTYDSGKIQVGYSGIVFFPVVPGQIAVYIGNTNAFDIAAETVTIIYYS